MLETLPSQYLYIWLSLSNTESEANLNNNLMMRRAGLSMETIQVNFTLTWLILSCQLLRVFLSEPNVSLVEDDTLVSAALRPATRDTRSLYILRAGFIGWGKATRAEDN